jgi:hypothetical protein
MWSTARKKWSQNSVKQGTKTQRANREGGNCSLEINSSSRREVRVTEPYYSKRDSVTAA